MELFVDNLGMNFEGVARKDGKVFFVPNALPGELIEARLVRDKKKFAEAELEQIKKPSPNRVQPFCPYYADCGGCDLQHVLYEYALNEKRKKVKETLNKVGELDVSVDDTVPSDDVYFYRNKGAFPILNSKVGMFKKSSHDLLDINQCFLMNDKIQAVFSLVKDFVAQKNFKGYDYSTNQGDLKYLVVRSQENQTLVCLVATRKIDNLGELFNILKEKFENVGLYLNINTQKNSTILGGEYIHIGGIKTINLNEYGINYSIDVASFLQVNPNVKDKIYRKILKEVEGENLVDAYAGAGLLSAMVSKKAKQVFSVEIVKQASENAKKLVKLNNISNMTVINGDCTQELPKLAKNLDKFTLVLDPARVGCSEKVIEVAKRAEKIIYLSCNPIALAKDLKMLKNSHEIMSCTPYDMFAQTKHVEVLTVLKRKK